MRFGVGVQDPSRRRRAKVRSPRRDQRLFSQTADRVRVENTRRNPMRGGIRL